MLQQEDISGAISISNILLLMKALLQLFMLENSDFIDPELLLRTFLEHL
jgi:hypothetical protein